MQETLLSVLALICERIVSVFLPAPRNPPPVGEMCSSNGRPPEEAIRGCADGCSGGGALDAKETKVETDINERGVCARSW